MGFVDDALCDQMKRHVSDCEPCQAFLASLQTVITQCRRYEPRCTPERREQMRLDVLSKYFAAQKELQAKPKRRSATDCR
jgi:hypothetical protein